MSEGDFNDFRGYVDDLGHAATFRVWGGNYGTFYRMKAWRIWLALCLCAACLAGWWIYFRDDWTETPFLSVTSLSIAPLDPSSADRFRFACITGKSENAEPALFGGPIDIPEVPEHGLVKLREIHRLFGPSTFRAVDRNGAENGQIVGRDRLYYIGIDRNGVRELCLARKSGDQWEPGSNAILGNERSGNWGPGDIYWTSVLPPDQVGGIWRVWYIGHHVGGSGLVGYATSSDGIQWKKAGGPIHWGDGRSIRSVSIVPFAGELRAWFVQLLDKEFRLVTATVSSQTGELIGPEESVSWQAPRDWRLGLPKKNIPILDARAESLGERRVRLSITYEGANRKPAVTVAENFPVGEIREPTVFSRQVEPVAAVDAR